MVAVLQERDPCRSGHRKRVVGEDLQVALEPALGPREVPKETLHIRRREADAGVPGMTLDGRSGHQARL